MNKELKDILTKLELDKCKIESFDRGETTLDTFKNWTFSTVYDKFANECKIITFESVYFWTEQIYKTLMPVRKKCMNMFNYDLLPLDYDQCSVLNLWDCKTNNKIKQSIINKIWHICKKHNIPLKYIIRGEEDFNNVVEYTAIILFVESETSLLKFSDKQCDAIKYLRKYLKKKYNISDLRIYEYYNIK